MRSGLSLDEARRMALAAQGFDRPRPGGRVDARHLRRTIQQLGLLQIDFVNVLVPAHYQVPFSRLGPYQRSRLDDLVYRRREFTEQWAHEASILPMQSWPLLDHRREEHRDRPYGFAKILQGNAGYAAEVLQEVRRRGPLAADDLREPAGLPRRIPGAWIGSVGRAVLEAHFGRGRLAVAARKRNFARIYDLAERIVPREYFGRKIGRDAAQRQLLLRAARSHGVGVAGDLADYYRIPITQARPRLDELAEAGQLQRVHVEGWREMAYLDPGARLPRRIAAATLLSPFDPLIWTRARLKRLFDFDYRVEIFVPQAKRRWGYYVLPFLLGDRLVARVDLKADRRQRRLMVPAAHIELDADPAKVAPALATELQTMAGWLELDGVSVGRRGNLARRLAAAARD